MVYGSPPARRTGPINGKENHIMPERRRREKINKRFIQLSTLIPGLKKLNKATILSDAAGYVQELQQKLKALEDAPTGRSNASMASSLSLPSGAPVVRNRLPEIEVQFSEKAVTLRILCDDAEGLLVRVVSEVEEGLHLSITHANTMRSKFCTLIITITAEVDEGFTLTSEDIIGRLNSALVHHGSCSSTEDK